MNGIKTFGYLFLLTMLLIAVGWAVDIMYGGGRGGFLLIFGVIAIVMNVVTYWFADTIVLKMHRARVVDESEAPELHAIVDRLVRRAKLPKPKVCVIENQVPNAFATGRNRSHSAVAVTTGLMSMLSEDELEGVIAHELAHIKHYDMLLGTVIAVAAGVIGMIAFNARWSMLFFGGRSRNSNPLALVAIIFLAVLAPLLALFIRSMISQKREFAADAGGAAISGNPSALASALRRMEREVHSIRKPNLGTQATAHLYFINHFSVGRGVAKLMSTHPPTEERIERLLAIHEKSRNRHDEKSRYNRNPVRR